MNFLKVLGAFTIFAFIFGIVAYLLWNQSKCRPVNTIRRSTIEGGGYGVFASKNYSKGDVVERCLLVKEKHPLRVADSTIEDYMFSDHKGGVYTSTGSCPIFNADENDPDVRWSIKGRKLVMRAVKDIPSGKEVFTTYGERYWKTRGIKPTQPPKQNPKPLSGDGLDSSSES